MRANCFYCDRCGKFFDEDKDFKGITRNLILKDAETPLQKSEKKDICPECQDDLERWFDSGKDKMRGGDDEDETTNRENV